MTLYNELKEAGIPLDSHSSDLYFKISPASLAILEKYPLEKRNSRPFRSQIDKEMWMDVPFAFIPWWLGRTGRASTINPPPQT
jgi:hypothetical protein